jgi:riboflavin kinase/FMN adenylyltransferase
VHLGHRQLIAQAIEAARGRSAAAAVLTFWPHPAYVLAPDRAPPLIANHQRKLELLQETGVNAVIEQHFDRDFAAMSPAAFEKLLLDEIGARAIVVGYDFTYGRQRGGNTQTLQKACEERSAALVVVPPVSVNGLVASSTKVREFVLGGNVEAAASLLGRPFDLEGPVVQGAGRGRTINVPTANIAPLVSEGQTALVPGIGVYAVRVTLPDGSVAAGACNVGLNPTFQPENPASRSVSIEVHLLDRSQDLYGQQLRLSFVARIRAERRFPSVDALIAQIRQDIEETRRILASA